KNAAIGVKVDGALLRKGRHRNRHYPIESLGAVGHNFLHGDKNHLHRHDMTRSARRLGSPAPILIKSLIKPYRASDSGRQCTAPMLRMSPPSRCQARVVERRCYATAVGWFRLKFGTSTWVRWVCMRLLLTEDACLSGSYGGRRMVR